MMTLERSRCAVLPLVLKGTWYDMIERGEKREEYRDATDYWVKRIGNWRLLSKPNRRRVVEFRRGYARNAPRVAFACEDVEVMEGYSHPEWGEPEHRHFTIWLGERVELVDALKAAPEPRTWHDVPHSPLPFRDGGGGVFVAADGRVPFTIRPFERQNESPGDVYERFKGDYHYMLCAINCHEALVEAAKKLLMLMEGRKEDTRELRALIARAEEHFE